MKLVKLILVVGTVFFFTVWPVSALLDPDSKSPCADRNAIPNVQSDSSGRDFHPCLLEPLPTGAANENSPTFEEYLTFVYRFAIAAAALIATGQIVYAGSLRIWGGVSEKSLTESREIIERSLWGLGLALSSYLILYTINPSLAEIKLEIPNIIWDVKEREETVTDTEGAINGIILGEAGYSELEKETRAKIINAGLDVNNVNSCGDLSYKNFEQATGGAHCTSVAGLSEQTIEKLKNLEAECAPCLVRINGGTERGHTSHGPDDIVDLDKDRDNLDSLTKYIIKKAGSNTCLATVRNSVNAPISVPAYVIGEMKFVDEGNHWHVDMSARC